ncbi:MAG: DUF5018 domain-containing protein [Bacteroidales bacterium]|nr:DUF5018 domain-containing protein [Bacteroidales bacterium]
MDENSSESYINPKDAQIYGFSLSTNKIPGLSSVRFTINQLDTLIYNPDSLPHGTSLSKALCTLTLQYASAVIMAEATNDTVVWKSTDSIDFSQPVKIRVFSYDGSTTKTYTVKINVHQQQGDAFSWKLLTDKALNRPITEQRTVFFRNHYYTYIKGEQEVFTSPNDGESWFPLEIQDFPLTADLFSLQVLDNMLCVATTDGELHISSDGRKWEKQDNTPQIKTLLGAYNGKLLAIVEKDGKNCFTTTNDLLTWEYSSEEIPNSFPVAGFGAASNEYGLIVACGKDSDGKLLNSVWLTNDGLSWTLLTDEKNHVLDKREGVAIVYYAECYYAFGGRKPAGDDWTYVSDVYVSQTNGVTWTKTDIALNDFYTPRAFASAHIKDNKLFLFGGANNDNAWIDDVWRGFLNKLGFEKK